MEKVNVNTVNGRCLPKTLRRYFLQVLQYKNPNLFPIGKGSEFISLTKSFPIQTYGVSRYTVVYYIVFHTLKNQAKCYSSLLCFWALNEQEEMCQ